MDPQFMAPIDYWGISTPLKKKSWLLRIHVVKCQWLEAVRVLWLYFIYTDRYMRNQTEISLEITFFSPQLPAGEEAGRPTAATRRWSWRRSSCSILTWPASGASKCLTHWPSLRGRWRSGFRTDVWSGKKNTTKTSFPAAKRNKSKLRERDLRGARHQKNTHQEKRTRRLPVILNSLLTITSLQSINCNLYKSLRFKMTSVDTQRQNTKPIIYSI